MHIQIDLLGRFSVRIDGHRIPDVAWARRDAASLVKLLAIGGGRQLHREQVMDLLWPEVAPIEAAPRLHKAAHYARRALNRPESIVLREEMVALFPGQEVRIDLTEFEDAASAALKSSSKQAAERVLDTYEGEPLSSDLYAEWAADVREQVRARRRRLMRQALRWRAIVDSDPLDEEAHLAIMSDLTRTGDYREVLRQFELMDRTFRRELGAPPGPEAAQLREQAASALRRIGAMTPADEGRVQQPIGFCETDDGVTLAYARSGGGAPLIKAANWLTHIDHDWRSPVWGHWLVELSRRYLLVRYDERGCGLSDWEVGDTNFEDWVTDLESVIEAAGVDRFPLLGISQGAPLAVTYASRHPDRVTRLVLYGGYAQGLFAWASDDGGRRRLELQIELARLGWGTDDPAFRQVFTSQFMPDGSRELWDSFNELQRQTTSAENAARVLTIAGSIDVRDEAARVRVPTLVLHARNDHRPPFHQGELLASLIPDSRFVALESNNHILLADEPAWRIFLAEVGAFLDEH